MLTAMPTKTAVCRTRTLTPSVTIGSSPKELLDEPVADRGDHVSAGERRAVGWRAGIDRLEDLPRRRVFHLRDSIARMEDATPREILEAVDARAPPDGAAFACGNMVTSVGYGLVEELLGRGSDGHAGS